MRCPVDELDDVLERTRAELRAARAALNSARSRQQAQVDDLHRSVATVEVAIEALSDVETDLEAALEPLRAAVAELQRQVAKPRYPPTGDL